VICQIATFYLPAPTKQLETGGDARILSQDEVRSGLLTVNDTPCCVSSVLPALVDKHPLLCSPELKTLTSC
jgi:hypothetical protein